MARAALELPDRFIYSMEIPLRMDDMNHGGHLGHERILVLAQEARVMLLKQWGMTERDLGGSGLILRDAVIVYRSQGFYGDVLKVEVAVRDVDRRGCDFIFRLTNTKTGKEVARVKTGALFFDYDKQELTTIPERFRLAAGSPEG